MESTKRPSTDGPSMPAAKKARTTTFEQSNNKTSLVKRTASEAFDEIVLPESFVSTTPEEQAALLRGAFAKAGLPPSRMREVGLAFTPSLSDAEAADRGAPAGTEFELLRLAVNGDVAGFKALLEQHPCKPTSEVTEEAGESGGKYSYPATYNVFDGGRIYGTYHCDGDSDPNCLLSDYDGHDSLEGGCLVTLLEFLVEIKEEDEDKTKVEALKKCLECL